MKKATAYLIALVFSLNLVSALVANETEGTEKPITIQTEETSAESNA